jgi:hypothetical protein
VPGLNRDQMNQLINPSFGRQKKELVVNGVTYTYQLENKHGGLNNYYVITIVGPASYFSGNNTGPINVDTSSLSSTQGSAGWY